MIKNPPKKSFQMTGFKTFQTPFEFEPMACPDCDQKLRTADDAAKHYTAEHSGNEFDKGHHFNLDDVEDTNEKMNEDEKMDEDQLNEEEKMDDLEAKAEFEAIFGDENAEKMSIEELVAPGSTISKIYDQQIDCFNNAECSYCQERFHSKIAYVNHMIKFHQISSNELVKLGNDRLSMMKIVQNADSIDDSNFDRNWGPVQGQKNEKTELVFTLIPNNKDSKIDQNDHVLINQDKFDNILVSEDYDCNSDPPSLKMPPKDIDKFDDIPVSTSGENFKDSGFDSCCQETLGKHDDIPISSNVPISNKDIYESDSDPPSPIIRPRDTDRAQEEEDDFGWMVFPNGQTKKRKFPDPRYAPEVTDKELEGDEEYQQLINECSSEKQ